MDTVVSKSISTSFWKKWSLKMKTVNKDLDSFHRDYLIIEGRQFLRHGRVGHEVKCPREDQ